MNDALNDMPVNAEIRPEIRFAVGRCRLGAVLAASSTAGIRAIFLGDDVAELVRTLQSRWSGECLTMGDAEFERDVLRPVITMVDDPSIGLHLPLETCGTPFQEQVWAELRRIPPGELVTYAELARRVGRPEAVRAVAGACAANAIAVAIPCHRVVRADGSLSGYRWGIDRKRELIRLEREAASAETFALR
jgi:AraC family transcriptional regulator of adaptative response/methylated-DNA-[protein]-cysteine methyltransferase